MELRSTIEHQSSVLDIYSRSYSDDFKSVFSVIPAAMAIVDLDGYILETNPALDRYLEYEPGTIKGMHFKEITHADDIERDTALFVRVVSQEIPSYTFRKRYICRSGKVISAQLGVTPIIRDSKVVRIIGMFGEIKTPDG